jgi:hypothetical protein
MRGRGLIGVHQLRRTQQVDLARCHLPGPRPTDALIPMNV